MKLKLIIPKGLAINYPKLAQAVEDGLDEVAVGIQNDFLKTVATWRHAGSFKFPIERKAFHRTISTTSQKYGWVNEGTAPHLIAPKNKKALRFRGGFSPKTAVRVIGSSAGGASGPVVVRRKAIRHPGTKAREFDQAIVEAWEAGPLLAVMERHIAAAAS